MRTDLKFTRRWHTTVLLALLAVWSFSSFVGIVLALADAPRGMGLGWLDYYVFLSIPILIGVGACLLFA